VVLWSCRLFVDGGGVVHLYSSVAASAASCGFAGLLHRVRFAGIVVPVGTGLWMGLEGR
jgi:hypothetical protein